MGRKKKVGVSGRFGSRYGATLRKRLALIEAAEKKPHPCPNCGSLKVKRKSIGIWKCSKCNFTFAGGAYLPKTKIGQIAQRGKVPSQAEKNRREKIV